MGIFFFSRHQKLPMIKKGLQMSLKEDGTIHAASGLLMANILPSNNLLEVAPNILIISIFFSVLLLAIADSNYKFTYVDIGAAGRAGDAGVYNNSTIKQALVENSINLPPATAISGIEESNISYHLVGDDAFALSTSMMKPFPHRNLDYKKRIFNYGLSRARRVIENAFGIMANRFRLLLTTINLQPEKKTHLVIVICCLHNYLIEKNKHTYTSV